MKIGIYGGTFDPPHNGHVHACRAFYNAFDMDKLFVIPNAIPPHKERHSKTTNEYRLEMTRLAFEGIGDKIEVSDIELKRAGKSYTKYTIEHFVDCGADEILLLCGTDMFVTFDTWYDFEYIFKNATIVCIRREDDKSLGDLILEKYEQYKRLYDAKIEFINVEAIEASSSEIRGSVDSQKAKELLPKAVFDFIIEKGLYR